MKSFSRGIHPQDSKERSAAKPIKEALSPRKVILPLQQNLGCPCEPLVKVGDEVSEGEKIADSAAFVSAPIHAPISGRVTEIKYYPNACDYDIPSIVIEATDAVDKVTRPGSRWTLEELAPEQIRKIIREAGLVGLGGAAFPTHVKLAVPKGKTVDTVVVNGCECEPFITSDHRVMVEKAAAIILGARALAKAVGAEKIVVGIESNKLDAYKAVNFEGLKVRGGVSVVQVKTKYPQGGEKMLIKALLDREVPSGGLPSDVGAVVCNVATAAAAAEAVTHGLPLTKRVVTVTGPGIKEPQNLLVKIGTPFAELIEQCGGTVGNVVKLIMGGPMMGIAVPTAQVPVVKATSAILLLTDQEVKVEPEGNCIRCGRCVRSCPIGLTPNFLAEYAKTGNWQGAYDYNVIDCIECGCCGFVCPSRIPLVQYFKLAKNAVRELKLAEKKAVCR
ncbi:electron transporter RnfC [candidate division WOR-1 bacterium RIFOXYA12_FULL_52_29]|uniref:Ion-translocating oxidoreductase complex subunit C n=1 Tax=candidate division WOR-1 bacterium RIFOXYC12_FULL_54_18 TaxID=1802584 RepID=A0A1F4T5W4_UNCSA|nr:MAG: electron transporter RnfC [candidate division WOR-1 bacterium RIFOXYA2_FULL_51_19]OGC17671.1 MAG: electron transporter RnfC [candidate division WOR-1 bacterium RIFOXYA12_FULL_52_29]OGC26528.1 MAG: electron transporter RnfC [candidate division WOR-1 bacterium RIFOXYB2_FULL_45_9]OGC28088.1 MAG: electron transporter RnfC [candidate division WOR-1 bacterium RIFOXYC12_FULL_54_18]OGC29626.1 MAG: electron transporter RnfC [candidate division WOR-1 bacterium RIFOXYB12_FULL_52_16]